MRPQSVSTTTTVTPSVAPVSETLQRIEQGWVAAMPPEIAEDLFGVPAGSLVTFFAAPGQITALMNLALQTEEAREREPGWILEMPPDIAAATGSAEDSLMVVYAKAGTLRVEIIGSRPEARAGARRYFEKYRAEAEELARQDGLGDRLPRFCRCLDAAF
jgi:hypothetical protein